MMKRLLTLAVVLSVLLIGISSIALANTYTVIPGDDIQAVIDAANTGDTIVFALGTYSLSATLTVNKPLTLTSEDPYAMPKPVIDGGGSLGTIIYIAADGVTLDGLEIVNGTGDLIYQGGSYSGTTVRNCVVHDSWSPGDEGIQLKSCTNCLVECNRVYDVAQDGISIAENSHTSAIRNNEIYNVGSENAAIYVYDSYDMTVECNYIHGTQAANGVGFYYNYGGTHTIANNLIVHNSWWGGKHCYDEADGSAIWIYKPRVASAYLVGHNTLDDNIAANSCAQPGNAIYVKKSASGVAVNVDDNIVTNHNGYGIRTWSGAAVNYSYNDLWQNALGATDGTPVDGGGNISSDPLFNSDYTLKAGSPCIGKASDGKDMGVVFTDCGCAPPAVEVTIDIKPGSDPNCFNSDGHGVIPVAILGSIDFDVTQIDPGSVNLDSLAVKAVGKGDKLLAHIEDVNSDGWDDLVVQIQDQDGAFTSGSGTAVLSGNLWDGTSIKGTDSICIVP